MKAGKISKTAGKQSDPVQAKAQNQGNESSILHAYQNRTIQLKTDITHTTSNFTYKTGKGAEMDTVGTEMTAYLDPSDAVTGSEPGASEQKNLMSRLKGKYKLKPHELIKGHLLNHDLGGYGVSANLFPISKDANGSHLHYAEYGVKAGLNTAKSNKGNKKNPNGVYYSVSVKSALDEDNYKDGSTFTCNAYMVDDIENKRTLKDPIFKDITIESSPGKNIDENGWAHDENDNDAESFSRSSSPKDWDHKGRGRRGQVGDSDWDDELLSTRIKVK